MKQLLLIVLLSLNSNLAVIAQQASPQKKRAEGPRVQLSFMLGAGVGTNGNVSAAFPSAMGTVKPEGNLSQYSFRGEYYFSQKWAAGFQHTTGEHLVGATVSKGSKYVPASWFIFYFPEHTIYYEDRINITAVTTEYTAYAAYRIVDYKKKVCPVEIIARGGIAAVSIEEEVQMNVSDKVSSNTFTAEGKAHRQEETGVNAMANISLQLHLGKRISLLLVDFTQRIAVYNPEFESVSVSNEISTLTLGKHKLPTAGFTYCAGMTFSF